MCDRKLHHANGQKITSYPLIAKRQTIIPIKLSFFRQKLKVKNQKTTTIRLLMTAIKTKTTHSSSLMYIF